MLPWYCAWTSISGYLLSKVFSRSPKGMMRLPAAKTTRGVFPELTAGVLVQPLVRLVRQKKAARRKEGMVFIVREFPTKGAFPFCT
jgi:hypothetical protein